MKIFKHRNIMGVIYGLVLAIPFLSILARSAYVTINKNAYQSYSNEFVENVTYVDNTDYFSNGLTYTFSKKSTTGQGAQNTPFLYTKLSFNPTDYGFQNRNYVGIGFHTGEDGFLRMWYYNDSNVLTYEQRNNIWGNTLNSFTLIYNGGSTEWRYANINLITYSTSKLDNAFEYSLSEFVDDNHFGNLNFFEWFSSLFLDLNFNNNALYVHFVNWYMNYALFISCAYILFLVLMWFINFSRRILERGMNYDW